MLRLFFLSAFLALLSFAQAQCGSGTPHATVTGSSGNYRALRGSTQLYAGSDYRLAIQTALDGISSGQRVSVLAAGNLGANTITIASGKIFEGCAAINTANRSGRGAIESLNQGHGGRDEPREELSGYAVPGTAAYMASWRQVTRFRGPSSSSVAAAIARSPS